MFAHGSKDSAQHHEFEDVVERNFLVSPKAVKLCARISECRGCLPPLMPPSALPAMHHIDLTLREQARGETVRWGQLRAIFPLCLSVFPLLPYRRFSQDSEVRRQSTWILALERQCVIDLAIRRHISWKPQTYPRAYYYSVEDGGTAAERGTTGV